MAYSPKQWRAIRLHSERHGVVPQLSAFPNVRFMDKAGKITVFDIGSLEIAYEASQKELSRTRAGEARERRKAAKEAERKL